MLPDDGSNKTLDPRSVRSSPSMLLVIAFLLAGAANALAASNTDVVRDLAGRVGPIVGSALACRDIARPRIQTIIDKFAAVIREASASETDRASLTQALDRSVADGRNAIATGQTDCKSADRQLADLERSIAGPTLSGAAGPSTAAAATAATAAPAGAGPRCARHHRQGNQARDRRAVFRRGQGTRAPDEARHRHRVQPGQRCRRHRGPDAPADRRRRWL